MLRFHFTPLHVAVFMGNSAMVPVLARRNPASLVKREKNGYAPLYLAAQCNQGPCVEKLLEVPTDICLVCS